MVAAESKDIKGGVGIFVTGIGIGYQAKKQNENSTVSLVKFSVPVFLPQQKVELKPAEDGGGLIYPLSHKIGDSEF